MLTSNCKEVKPLISLINIASDIDSNTSNYLPPTPSMSPNTTAFAQSGDLNIREARVPFSPNADRKNFYKRAFGKLGKGSLRGSVFALCASAIGSGVLSLPYVLGLNGWILGLVFIIVGGFCK